jgi:hypothetical protein
MDMSGNSVSEIANTAGVRAVGFTEDTTPPTLLNFSISMNSAVVSLTFDEPVEMKSFKPSFLLLQDSRSINAENVTLTQYSEILSSNGRILTFKFVSEDTDDIKRKSTLFSSLATSFISATAHYVGDMNGVKALKISETGAIAAMAYTADTTSPYLRHYTLDMDNGEVSLTFSEVLNVSSILFSRLQFQTTSNSAESVNVAHILTGGNLKSYANDLVVTFAMLDSDMSLMKINGIGQSRSSTYLAVDEGALYDQAGEKVDTVLSTNAMGMQKDTFYTADTTVPVLKSMELDMNVGIVSLTFNEVIATVNTSKLTLASSEESPACSNNTANNSNSNQNQCSASSSYRIMTLTSSTKISPGALTKPNKVVLLQLGNHDLNKLKAIPELAVSNATTFLACEKGMVQDASISNPQKQGEGNELEAISLSSAFKGGFVQDKVRPRLDDFDLDMNGEPKLVLTFSETVRVDSSGLDVTAITLFEEGGQKRVLTGGTVSNINDPVVTIVLNANDANEIKSKTNLAVPRSNGVQAAFIAVTDGLVKDMNNNKVELIQLSDRKAVQNFKPDITSPALTSFVLDMNDGSLTLVFSETVKISSVYPTEIQIKSSTFSASHALVLSKGTVSSTNLTTFEVAMDIDDLNSLKKNTNLGTGLGNTAVGLTNLTCKDMEGNNVVATVQMASGYVEDTTAPELVGFDLDLTNENMTLTFSETVRPSTFKFDLIAFQDNVSPGESVIGGKAIQQLSNGSVLTKTFGTVLTMKLESRDLNGMKQIPELDRGSPVFIKLSKGAVSDMSNVEIEEKVLKNTSAIVLDTVAPLLTEFTYNATTLTIKFSEPVKNGTYIGEKFYLANSSSTPYSFVSLRGSRVVTNTDKQVITVDVTANLDDINKNNKLCTDDDDCFMIHDAGAIADVSNNPIQKRDFANALAVSSYINDVNPPVLQSIESFDLNKGQLTLSFSEVVHGGGIDFTKIQLRQFFSLSDPNAKTKTLTQGISSPSYGKIITLTLREDDINTIKTTDNFCVSTFSCFLSYEAGFVKDSSGAPIVASSSESQSFRIGLRPQKNYKRYNQTSPYKLHHGHEFGWSVSHVF